MSSWSLVQRTHTECGVCECDREASIMKRSWSTGKKKIYHIMVALRNPVSFTVKCT